MSDQQLPSLDALWMKVKQTNAALERKVPWLDSPCRIPVVTEKLGTSDTTCRASQIHGPSLCSICSGREPEGMQLISTQSWHARHTTCDGGPHLDGEEPISGRLLLQVLGTGWATFFHHRRNVDS